ncbi:MAG: hypothetical protein ACRCWY_05395 [Cellulosilyticaceae bacterium]
MRLYHGSPIAGIQEIRPHISNHGERLVYMTAKRDNTLVYLSNAIEKFHKEQGLVHEGHFYKWASYGFNREKQLVIDEYYPNATEDTYRGVAGYIYYADDVADYEEQKDIPFAVVAKSSVVVSGVEYIEDAYEEMLKLEKQGAIIIRRYENHSPEKLAWIEKVIREDYETYQDKQDYRVFLEGKFPFLNA